MTYDGDAVPSYDTYVSTYVPYGKWQRLYTWSLVKSYWQAQP